MTTRRKFLGAAAAASAVPLVPFAFPVPASAAISLIQTLYKVIIDRRVPASVAFGDTALASGVAVASMAGDVTDIWYDDLFYRWRDATPEDAVAIAGITMHGPLFCLERLASEHGLRVVYRGDHMPSEWRGSRPDTLKSRLQGPPPFHGRGSPKPSPPRAGEGWERTAPSQDRAGIVTDATFGHLTEPLVSWLIA